MFSNYIAIIYSWTRKVSTQINKWKIEAPSDCLQIAMNYIRGIYTIFTDIV